MNQKICILLKFSYIVDKIISDRLMENNRCRNIDLGRHNNLVDILHKASSNCFIIQNLKLEEII